MPYTGPDNPIQEFFNIRELGYKGRDARRRWSEAGNDHHVRRAAVDALRAQHENTTREVFEREEFTGRTFHHSRKLLDSGEEKIGKVDNSLSKVEDPFGRKEQWKNAVGRSNRTNDKLLLEAESHINLARATAHSESNIHLKLLNGETSRAQSLDGPVHSTALGLYKPRRPLRALSHSHLEYSPRRRSPLSPPSPPSRPAIAEPHAHSPQPRWSAPASHQGPVYNFYFNHH